MVYNSGVMSAPTIRIDPASQEAVYVQIAARIRAAIATGRLEAGVSLPPIRAIASDLGVNLNTVARAYRLLESEGFVAIRGRAGVVVAAPAGRAGTDTRDRLVERLGEVLARMRQAGISPKDLEKIVARELASLRDAGPDR